MIYECSVPLYRVRCYGDNLFRVTKRLFNPTKVSVKKKSEPDELPVGKFDSALSRARNVVVNYALCNKWEYFVTFTFDNRWDRYSLESRLKEFLQWVQNENKKGSNIRYLLVPEFHKDGAVHLHGLISGIDVAERPLFWPKSVNRKKDGSGYYDHWPAYSERYGYSSVDPVKSLTAVGFYITKYITKSLADMVAYKGVHTYYHSRGLLKSLEVGNIYHESLKLDKCCKFANHFYAHGFFKCDDVGRIVDDCEEVGVLYQNYVITDPVSGELVALVGGDDQDEYIQEILEDFKFGGMCLTPVFPDD